MMNYNNFFATYLVFCHFLLTFNSGFCNIKLYRLLKFEILTYKQKGSFYFGKRTLYESPVD